MANSIDPSLKASTATRNKVIAGIAAAALLVAAGYFFYTAPALASAAKAQKNAAVAQAALPAATSQLDQAQTDSKSSAVYYVQAQQLDKLLPPVPKDGDPGLVTLPALVTSSGMGLTAVGTEISGKVGGATYFAYPVTATGTPAQLLTLLSIINNRVPVTTVDQVTSTTTSGGVAYTMSIRFWYSSATQLPSPK